MYVNYPSPKGNGFYAQTYKSIIHVNIREKQCYIQKKITLSYLDENTAFLVRGGGKIK